MYIYCDYPAKSKGPKQLPNCLKTVVLNVFKGVIYDVSTYTECRIKLYLDIGKVKKYQLLSNNFTEKDVINFKVKC
jgi:hypothetical protein